MDKRPLPFEYPPQPPDWLEQWPAPESIEQMFSEGVRRMVPRVIRQGTPARIRWSPKALTMEVGKKNPYWRWINGQWQIGCSCGYPGGKCPHVFAAASVFDQILQREEWCPGRRPLSARGERFDTFKYNRPQPSRKKIPPLHGEDLFSWAETRPPEKIPERQLQVEIDLGAAPGKVGVRFYLFQENRRRLIRMQQLYNMANSARFGTQERDGWQPEDRRFLSWLSGQVLKRQLVRSNSNYLRIGKTQFEHWQDRWAESPDRFIERSTQQPLRPGAGEAEAHIELTPVDGGIEIALMITTPSGKRIPFHDLAKQLAAGNGQLLLDGQPCTIEFPVSGKLLLDVFSRHSPVVPADKICEHLPPLIQNRLDLVKGEAVIQQKMKRPLRLRARSDGGDVVISGYLDGAEISLRDGRSPSLISRKGDKFLIRTPVCECLPEVRAVMERLDARPDGDGGYRLPGRTALIRRFVEAWEQLPATIHRQLSPELTGLFGDSQKVNPVLNSVDNGLFVDLNVVYVDQPGGNALSALEVFDALRRQSDIIRTRNGSWLRLDLQSLQKSSDELAAFGFDVNGRSRMFAPEARRLFANARQTPGWMLAPDTRSLARRIEKSPVEETPLLSASMKTILREYQIEGFHFLNDRTSNHVGAILADDMGLGKTVQVLALLEAFRARHGGLVHCSDQPEANAQRPPSKHPTIEPSSPGMAEKQSRTNHPGSRPRAGALIICPASVVSVWDAEIRKFSPGLRSCLYSGLPGERKKLLNEDLDTWDVLIANYSILRNDIEDFMSYNYSFVVLDEAQQIKNPDALITRAVKQLKTPRPLALTGTPIENRLTDLWSIMDFLNPGFLGQVDDFKISYDTPLARRALSRRIAPVVLRRSKELVAPELPPKTEELISVEMSEAQQSFYRRELIKARQASSGGGAMALFAALTRMRQVCCDPRLIDKDLGPAVGSAKLDMLIDMIQQVLDEGHSALVFSQFTSMLSLIEKRLQELCFPHRKITGATPTAKRAGIVREFNEEQQPEVFLLSLKAAGTGLTLTKADYVFLYDPWWNPAVENQAIDRTHRIGQDKPVFAYRLIVKGSVEEKVLALQQEKAELFAQVMADSEAAGVPKGLTSSDLQKLLA